MRKTPPIPVGARVKLKATGWTGVIVAHLRPMATEDRGHQAYRVRWDKSGFEGDIRNGSRLERI